MREETRKNITQILLPGVILFGALAMMYGPSYLRYIRQNYVAYSMLRDSMFGPIRYDVQLQSAFVSETGDLWHVYLLTDLEQSNDEERNRQELLLVDQDGRITNRDVETEVGAIRSSHLTPFDGYAMVEVTRHVPGDPYASEVVHYEVSSQEIAMVDSETRRHHRHWDWRFGPPRHFDPRHQQNAWRDRVRRHGSSEEAETGDSASDRWSGYRRGRESEFPPPTRNTRAPESKSTAASEKAEDRSEHDEDVKRSGAMRSNDKRLLDVGRLGGTGNEATEVIGLPN